MTTDAGAAELLALLRDRGWTVAVAESLTGGLVVASLVSVPGASLSLRGGVVAYDTAIKASVLGVDGDLLAADGPVHPQVALEMAEGVRRALAVDGRPADVGIATTGIAGPDSPDGQPVGTVHIGVATPEGPLVESFVFPGDRVAIREAARAAAIATALRAVGADPRDPRVSKV
ncbi:CinA family protein [Microbacterium rhizophilus]|uniref:CinA family protein n=1 Tax=Microbacterium rhizophilus TaxID=3138934 RepID=UPI0031EC922E